MTFWPIVGNTDNNGRKMYAPDDDDDNDDEDDDDRRRVSSICDTGHRPIDKTERDNKRVIKNARRADRIDRLLKKIQSR